MYFFFCVLILDSIHSKTSEKHSTRVGFKYPKFCKKKKKKHSQMQYKDCKDNSTFAPQALEGNIASWRKRTHGESRTRAHIHEYLEK